MNNQISEITNTEQNTNQVDLNDDWEKKYDITIEILKEEYLVALDRFKFVEEKANKYLVVISLFIAGFFTVLASSLSDKIILTNQEIKLSHLLSYSFLLCLVICIYYGTIILNALLNSLALANIQRLPNLSTFIDTYGEFPSVQYKFKIIESYQEVVNTISQSAQEKQKHIQTVSLNIKKFILWIFLSLNILFLLKFI